MSLALERLVGEHLLQRSGAGRLQAVHRLRSAALFDAIHNVPPPTREASITAAISAIDQHDIQPFMLGVLVDRPELTASVLDASPNGLAPSPMRSSQPVHYTPAGSSTSGEKPTTGSIASTWTRSQYAPRFVAANLAILGRPLEGIEELLQPGIAPAVRDITSHHVEPGTRDEFVARKRATRSLPRSTDCDDLEHAARLFASLAGNPSVAEALSDDQWIRGTRSRRNRVRRARSRPSHVSSRPPFTSVPRQGTPCSRRQAAGT